MGEVTGLFVYPVKGCGGVTVNTAEMTDRGFRADRRWMVVDQNGVFLSQRSHALLGKIFPRLEHGGIELCYGDATFSLPWAWEAGDAMEVRVWSSHVRAIRHPEASDWFSRALGETCSVVYMPDAAHRGTNPDYSREGDLVSFADGYPYLLTAEESLRRLQQEAGEALPMWRFRPNIVVQGFAPFAEDSWQRVQIGPVPFRGVKPCTRCSVTALDPSTGRRGKEPLRTLVRIHTWKKEPWFGMNLCADGAGVLQVGDEVRPILDDP